MAKILLVEDDKSLREIYGVRLMAEGYTIVSAGDGEEALALAIKERPDLILSDVMMPKISGFDMLDILRSTSETKDIKVIMMTALSSEDQRARGESLGADRYLVKSQVGIEDVVRTVHDVLGDGVAGAVPAAPTFPPAAASPAPAAPVEPVFSAPAESPAPSEPPVINLQSAPAPLAPTPTPAPAPVEPIMPTPADPAPVTLPEPPQSLPQPEPTPMPTPAESPVAPTPVTLPEPTAPFSGQRPASLGDRVINPISPTEDMTTPTDMAAQMNQELNGNAPAPAGPPPAPPTTPTV